MEDAHLLANKGRVKEVFGEVERARVDRQGSVGPGQSIPVKRHPKPSDAQFQMWRRAKMEYDPAKGIAKGKFTEEYWNGKKWASRRIR